MLSDKEKLDILIPKGMRLLAERIEKEVPDKGIFMSISVSFDYPGTACLAHLRLEPSARGDGTERCLRSYMGERGSDRVVSHYIYTATKDKILAWLKDRKNEAELRRSYEQLRQGVDRMD